MRPINIILIALVFINLVVGVVNAASANYGGLDVLDEDGYYTVNVTSGDLCAGSDYVLNNISWLADGYDSELTYLMAANWYDADSINLDGQSIDFSSSGTISINDSGVALLQLDVSNDEEVYDLLNFTWTVDYTCSNPDPDPTPIPTPTPNPTALTVLDISASSIFENSITVVNELWPILVIPLGILFGFAILGRIISGIKNGINGG